MTRLKLLSVSLAIAFVAAGCGGSGGTVPDEGTGGAVAPSGGGGGADDSSSGVVTTGLPGPGGSDISALTPQERTLVTENLVVYFEFDRSDVRSDFNAMLAAHGQLLATNPGVSVRLEGHADERGTREYNIGLGERRSQSVRQILLLQGAAAAQLATVSYGEERPAVFGSDEGSWSLNRRVELIYEQ